MNWHVRYRLTRETPLDDGEKDALLGLVRQARDSVHDFDLWVSKPTRADHVVCVGQLQMYYSGSDESDVRRLLEALTKLRSAVNGAELEVWDDYDLVGWSGDRFDTLGQCDVPRFDLPVTDDSFTKLSSLNWDFRFQPMVRTAAKALHVPDASSSQLVKVSTGPTFRSRPGERRQKALMSISVTPATEGLTLTGIQVGFFDKAGGLIDYEEHHLSMPCAGEVQITVELSAPDLLSMADHLEVQVTAEAKPRVALGAWTIHREGPALCFAPVDAPAPSDWPVSLTLGGFSDRGFDGTEDERWRLVGQVKLNREAQEATGELGFNLMKDGTLISHHSEYVRQVDHSRFGGWWYSAHDEFERFDALDINLALEVTSLESLGRWSVNGEEGRQGA